MGRFWPAFLADGNPTQTISRLYYLIPPYLLTFSGSPHTHTHMQEKYSGIQNHLIHKLPSTHTCKKSDRLCLIHVWLQLIKTQELGFQFWGFGDVDD